MKNPGFLSAEWRYLAMINYQIDADILLPFVPTGTEIDTWNDKTFVSMVGFMFLKTKVLNLSIPFHTEFEEVNLRFYVRRQDANGWRRGVVFIKELVPKRAIAGVARFVYNEKYQALPMRHVLQQRLEAQNTQVTAEYGWKVKGRWNKLSVKTSGPLQPIMDGSEEEFIAEHYWGYSSQRDGGCVEYQVEHPRWQVWQVKDSLLDCDVTTLYGPQFVSALGSTPSSAFLADGSAVVVRQGHRI